MHKSFVFSTIFLALALSPSMYAQNQGGNSQGSNSQGSNSQGTATPAPEINPGVWGSSLVLLAAGILIVRRRRTNK